MDGLRADLVTARAAIALAAWAGRDEVTTDDVRQAVLLALPHRRRRTPFEEPGLDESKLDEALNDAKAQGADEPEPDPDGPGGGEPLPDSSAGPESEPGGTGAESTAGVGADVPPGDADGARPEPAAGGRAADAAAPRG